MTFLDKTEFLKKKWLLTEKTSKKNWFWKFHLNPLILFIWMNLNFQKNMKPVLNVQKEIN